MLALILALALILPPAPPTVTILLVSPPGETWTPDEQERAVSATMDALAWWTRNSPVSVPGFVLGAASIITPADFSYTNFAWERPYYHHPTNNLTVFVIDNSSSHRTMAGALGWAQVPCKAITVLLSGSQDELASVIAHEYGHAILDLDHAPLGAFDIMAPSPSSEPYHTNTVGYSTRKALGEVFQITRLAMVLR